MLTSDEVEDRLTVAIAALCELHAGAWAALTLYVYSAEWRAVLYW